MSMIEKAELNLLKRRNITHAYFKDSYVRVYLEDRSLPKHMVKIVESEEWVGSWWKQRAENIIRLDSKIQERNWFLSVAVHEVIEKWLMYEGVWKLPYDIAHPISDTIEGRWHVKMWGLESWNDYMERVELIWEKENNNCENWGTRNVAIALIGALETFASQTKAKALLLS